MKREKYAKNDKAAAESVGVSAQTFSERKRAADFTIRYVAGKGWPISELLDDDAKRKRRDKRNLTGEHSDRKGRKLDVEIEILELKRDEIRGELIALAESRQHCTDIAGIVRWAAEQWPAKVAVLTKDAAQVAQAEALSARMLALCREKLEALA